MNVPTDKKFLGKLGELLVQADLLRYKVESFPPLMDSGTDLVAIFSKNKEIKFIQVKTISDHNKSKTFKGLSGRIWDILVCVYIKSQGDIPLLNNHEIYYIPKEKIGIKNQLSLKNTRKVHEEVSHLFNV